MNFNEESSQILVMKEFHYLNSGEASVFVLRCSDELNTRIEIPLHTVL